MINNFDQSVEFVLQHEGWRSNEAGDAGGRTLWGWTEKYNPEWVAAHWMDEAEVSKGAAILKYKDDVWLAIGCDTLPAGIDLLVFDCAVNQGESLARTIAHDGTILEAAWKRLIRYIVAQDHYDHTAARPQFLKGWGNRLVEVVALAGNMGGEL